MLTRTDESRNKLKAMLHSEITNNKIPVDTTGKAKSLDLFQRKHDKQAIQKIITCEENTKAERSPFQAPGAKLHNGKPV